MNAEGGRNRLSHGRTHYLVIQYNAALKTDIQTALYRSSRLHLGILYYVNLYYMDQAGYA